jgi:hypothetical protein
MPERPFEVGLARLFEQLSFIAAQSWPAPAPGFGASLVSDVGCQAGEACRYSATARRAVGRGGLDAGVDLAGRLLQPGLCGSRHARLDHDELALAIERRPGGESRI